MLDAALAAGIDDLLAAEGLDGPDGDASVRITVSRGAFRGRGLLPPGRGPSPTIVIQAWPVVAAAGRPPRARPAPRRVARSGATRQNPLATLKTTSRADYVYARLEARRAGADDALFLTIDGHLSEGTTANIFLVRGRRPTAAAPSWPRPRSTARSCRARRARGCCLGRARSGCARRRRGSTPADLAAADEAFLSSSVAGMLPVTRVRRCPDRRRTARAVDAVARADREAMIARRGVRERR